VSVVTPYKLAHYKAWADELFLQKLSQLSESQLAEPQPIVFGSLIRTLHHVYAMDFVWRAHLLGIEHGYSTRNPETHPAFEDLRGQQMEIDRWYLGYTKSLTDAQAEEVVRFAFIGGGEGAMSRGEILTHVVNHTTYHRGNMADMLWRWSIEPPTTDFPVFLRETMRSRIAL
jgi:uncharacterized damage-inducible protein DinB